MTQHSMLASAFMWETESYCMCQSDFASTWSILSVAQWYEALGDMQNCHKNVQ